MPDDVPAIMIFAAGFGTRMGRLTRSRPKPMIPVAGTRLIDRAIAMAEAVRPPRIVVNLHYLARVLEEHLEDRRVITVREEPEILETGGGLRNALPHLGSDPVMTANPDSVWAGPNPMRLALAAWEPERMDALLVCVPAARARGRAGRGDFRIDGRGRLRRGSGLVFGGVQVMKAARLHDQPGRAFSLNVVWDAMARAGRLCGVRYPGRWCDVGHPGGIAAAEDMLARRDV